MLNFVECLNLKRSAILSFCFASMFVFSCQNKKESNDCLYMYHIVHDKSASILGKWKLIKSYYPHGRQCNDYSQYDIIYEFKEDNVLTVSGEMYHILKTGEHFYLFDESEEWWGIQPILHIDGRTFYYRYNSKNLVLDLSPLDLGPKHFVRIK